MPITLEGVQPSSEMLDELATTGEPVILNFSRGKDSLALWIELKKRDVKVIPIHKSMCPGLKFIRDDLDRYEQHFGVHIVDMPSDAFYAMLADLVWQPPERCAVIEAAQMPKVDKTAYDAMCRAEYATDDTWILDGVRAADSPQRRMAFSTHGAKKEHVHRMSGIWDWRKGEVYDAIKAEGIELGIDYEWYGRSFDGLRYDYIKPIYDHAPEDWAVLKRWFPLIDMELIRGEWNLNGIR